MTADSWRDRALCAQVGGDMWFPNMGDSAKPAKHVCAMCPVRRQCLEYALGTKQEHGVWGGLSPEELRRLRRGAA